MLNVPEDVLMLLRVTDENISTQVIDRGQWSYIVSHNASVCTRKYMPNVNVLAAYPCFLRHNGFQVSVLAQELLELPVGWELFYVWVSYCVLCCRNYLFSLSTGVVGMIRQIVTWIRQKVSNDFLFCLKCRKYLKIPLIYVSVVLVWLLWKWYECYLEMSFKLGKKILLFLLLWL